MKRVHKGKVGPLLFVRWLDAHNFEAQWHLIDDFKPYRCEVHSVGWEISRDNEQLVMSADVSHDDDDTVMINTVFAIPVGCIVETTVLRRGDG